jgi:ComEC/Rec2-related protein
VAFSSLWALVRRSPAGFILHRVMIAMCVFASFYVYALLRIPRPGPNDLSHYAGRTVVVLGTVKSVDSGPDAHSARITYLPRQIIWPDRHALSGEVKVAIPRRSEIFLQPDLNLRLKALVVPVAPAQFPWQLDLRRYLARQGVYCQCIAREIGDLDRCPQAAGHPGLAEAPGFLEGLRACMVEANRKVLPADEADLLSSMVLGDRAIKLTGKVADAFRKVGLSHILAASGFNLTIVTSLSFLVASLVLRSVWLANGAAFVLMIIFVCLAGASPSVLRAALMCAMVLLSRCLFRTLSVPASLAFALIVALILDPCSICDIGLELSYAAAAGIIYGAAALAEMLGARKQERKQATRCCNKLRYWLAEAVAVVVIAQASVMPIQLFYFWRAGLLFLPANLLVTPLVTPATVLGFVSSVAAAIAYIFPFTATAAKGVIYLADQIAHFPLKLMLCIAYSMASIDWAQVRIGAPPLISIAVYYSALIAVFEALKRKKLRCVAFVLFGLSACFLCWRGPLPATTIVCFPKSVVVLDSSRRALVLPDMNEAQLDARKASDEARLLNYYGARLRHGDGDSYCAFKDVPDSYKIKAGGHAFIVVFLAATSHAHEVIRRIQERSPSSWLLAVSPQLFCYEKLPDSQPKIRPCGHSGEMPVSIISSGCQLKIYCPSQKGL